MYKFSPESYYSAEALLTPYFLSETLQNITLSDEIIRLEPLHCSHAEDLYSAGANDESIWTMLKYGQKYGVIRSIFDMEKYIEYYLALDEKLQEQTFAVIDTASEKAIGATRFMGTDAENHLVEIGGTWYGKSWRRTSVNTRAKFLLLEHAFTVLHCIRVQFTADSTNEKSCKAIERIGATREATLRNHLIRANATLRTTAVFSILPEEWFGFGQTSIRASLLQKIHAQK